MSGCIAYTKGVLSSENQTPEQLIKEITPKLLSLDKEAEWEFPQILDEIIVINNVVYGIGNDQPEFGFRDPDLLDKSEVTISDRGYEFILYWNNCEESLKIALERLVNEYRGIKDV